MSRSRSASRPLSPHLQVFKPPVTMVTSILHRLTGAALYFGILLICLWLLALAHGPQSFLIIQSYFNSLLGQIVWIGFSWALFQHLLGGLRHFIWDAGFGFDQKIRERLAWANLIGAPLLTAVFWIILYLL